MPKNERIIRPCISTFCDGAVPALLSAVQLNLLFVARVHSRSGSPILPIGSQLEGADSTRDVYASLVRA